MQALLRFGWTISHARSSPSATNQQTLRAVSLPLFQCFPSAFTPPPGNVFQLCCDDSRTVQAGLVLRSSKKEAIAASKHKLEGQGHVVAQRLTSEVPTEVLGGSFRKECESACHRRQGYELPNNGADCSIIVLTRKLKCLRKCLGGSEKGCESACHGRQGMNCSILEHIVL